MKIFSFITPSSIKAAYSIFPILSEKGLSLVAKSSIYCVCSTNEWATNQEVPQAFNEALDESYDSCPSVTAAVVISEDHKDIAEDVMKKCVKIIEEREADLLLDQQIKEDK